MGRLRATHCMRGHQFNASNTQWIKGGTVQRCKRCHATKYRLRYRNDPAYREKKLQRNKLYREKKHGTMQSSSKPYDFEGFLCD